MFDPAKLPFKNGKKNFFQDKQNLRELLLADIIRTTKKNVLLEKNQ